MSAVVAWLESEDSIKSAVLFGSSCKASSIDNHQDNWADIDLHIITTASRRIEEVDWARVLPSEKFCMQIVRPATGGVRKATVSFATGQIDLVLVPAFQIRLARLAAFFGLHRRVHRLKDALNELHTCIQSGYRFLKGEKEWGAFYTMIMTEMPGVRLTDDDARKMADIFLTELLLIFRRLERGEFAAAQYSLHRSLSETNFRLLRELRLRRGQPLPSFGIARHVETSLSPTELEWVRVNSRLERQEISSAAWRSFDGLKALMSGLVPAWAVPPGISNLLKEYFSRPQ